ncbi:MAG: nucleotide exchange factor GrpE [Patescibacteria group bacterium]
MIKKVEYPRVVVGALIFNEKDELFLMKTVQWKNRYTLPGGKLEIGEDFIEAVKREVKEETNMDIEDVELFHVYNGKDIEKEYTLGVKHFVFFDYKAKVKGSPKIELNEEGIDYKWLKVEDWLKKDKKIFPHKYVFDNIKKLARGDKEDYEHKYKLALADYQNLLKRTAQEKSEFAKYANEGLLHEILPIYDNLKTSLKFSDDEAIGNGWAEGVKYVVKQFKDTLEKLGVEEIKTKGEKFNPETMDALEGKGKKVKKEVKAGYMLNGKVIVAAKVIVW